MSCGANCSPYWNRPMSTTMFVSSFCAVPENAFPLATTSPRDRSRAAGTGLFLTTPLPARSEEHTSELQSLMRISYAVFCLKKKTNRQNNVQIHMNQLSLEFNNTTTTHTPKRKRDTINKNTLKHDKTE